MSESALKFFAIFLRKALFEQKQTTEFLNKPVLGLADAKIQQHLFFAEKRLDRVFAF